MKAGLLARPKDLIPTPVGEIDELWLIHFHNSRVLVIESRVVLRNRSVVVCGLAQFFRGSNAARNDRVWINQTRIARLNLRRRKSAGERCGRSRGRTGTAVVKSWLVQPANARHATSNQYQECDTTQNNAADSRPAVPPSAPTTRVLQVALLNTPLPSSLGWGREYIFSCSCNATEPSSAQR